MRLYLLPTRRVLSLACATLTLLSISTLRAQTVDDGIMLKRNLICTGVIYSNDQWTHYWEGSLNRTNGNLGRVTTQTINNSTNYALFSRLNILATTPFVWTQASQGVLRGQSGFQDFSLAVKYEVKRIPIREFADIRAIAVLSGSVPTTNYEPDIQPLALGLKSKTVAPRGILNLQARNGLFGNFTADYVFRGTVKLDRPYYYTNGQLYESNHVAMPNQFQYAISAGYYRHDLKLSGEFIKQMTRGGGDIRRQDMPFVSNRMNYSRFGFKTQTPIPHMHNLQYWLGYDYTYDGRNVGQSSTITTGLMYTVHLKRFSSL